MFEVFVKMLGGRGPGETAQSIECPSRKPEHVCLDPQNPWKEQSGGQSLTPA